MAAIKEEAQQVISDIVLQLQVTNAQLLLRWVLHHNYAALVKTTKSFRMAENLKIFEFEIPTKYIAQLDRLNQDQPIAWATAGLDPMKSAPTI